MQDDLSKFKISEFNRDLSEHHLRRLKASIQEKNLLIDHPILVTPDMVVIDGQHRLEVAKELGLPVWYKVAELTEWGDLANVNANTKNWTISDHLEYWCRQGKPHYLRLREFLRRNPFIGVNVAASLCAGLGADSLSGNYKTSAIPSNRGSFKEGKYQLTDAGVANAQIFVDMLKDYEQFYDGWKRRNFVKALFLIVGAGHYDHARMMHQLETYGWSVRLMHAASRDDYITQLNNAYNFNRKGENRVDLATGNFLPVQ